MLIFTLIGSSLDRKKKKAKIRACKKWKSCRSKACRLFPLTFRKIGTEREEDGASIRSRRCPELRGYHVKKSYSTRLLFHVYRSRLRASNKNKFTTRTFVHRRWVTITRYIRSQNYSWYITRDKSSPDILRRGKNLRESIFYLNSRSRNFFFFGEKIDFSSRDDRDETRGRADFLITIITTKITRLETYRSNDRAVTRNRPPVQTFYRPVYRREIITPRLATNARQRVIFPSAT